MGEHECSVETKLPEWLSTITIHGRIDEEIFKFYRRISSNSSFYAFSSNFFKQFVWKAQIIHSFSEKPDDRADRFKIAERFGDMITEDHKVLNEDQESKLHHRYAVVLQDLATQWIQSCPCKNQISSRDAEKSQQFLTSRCKPKIHLYGHFSGIY